MSEIAQNNDGPSLPPVISLSTPEAFDIWVIYRALDRRFLPSEIINEPSALLSDMLQLDSLYEALRPKESE
jgi:hypothetical protein